MGKINSSPLLRDHRLSFESIGLAVWCLSQSDDWEFNITEIKSSRRIGSQKLYRMLNELIEFGYCSRSQARDGSQFGGYEYRFSSEGL